jgi:hypothetical protein
MCNVAEGAKERRVREEREKEDLFPAMMAFFIGHETLANIPGGSVRDAIGK